jgi:hypothetical protein
MMTVSSTYNKQGKENLTMKRDNSIAYARTEYSDACKAFDDAHAAVLAARKAEREIEDCGEWQPRCQLRCMAERAMGVASHKRDVARKHFVGAIGSAWWDALHPFRVAAAQHHGRLTRPQQRRLIALQASFADLAKEAGTVGARLRPFNARRCRP